MGYKVRLRCYCRADRMICPSSRSLGKRQVTVRWSQYFTLSDCHQEPNYNTFVRLMLMQPEFKEKPDFKIRYNFTCLCPWSTDFYVTLSFLSNKARPCYSSLTRACMWLRPRYNTSGSLLGLATGLKEKSGILPKCLQLVTGRYGRVSLRRESWTGLT